VPCCGPSSTAKVHTEKLEVRSDAAPTSDWPGLFIGSAIVASDPVRVGRLMHRKLSPKRPACRTQRSTEAIATIACAARGFDVDLIVVAAEGGTVWQLTDLLGRSKGNIRENASHQFTIYPEGRAFETMADIQRGPHASLDAALAEIERHTRGVCRRSTG
jgi:hypothetical protein